MAVLPPVLGPVMMTARVPALMNTSIGTIFSRAGTCMRAQRQQLHRVTGLAAKTKWRGCQLLGLCRLLL